MSPGLQYGPSRNTIVLSIFCIGISPQTVITFVSNGWEGHASDKYIIKRSTILRNPLLGNVMFAGRWFSIEEGAAFCCAEVEVLFLLKIKSS